MRRLLEEERRVLLASTNQNASSQKKWDALLAKPSLLSITTGTSKSPTSETTTGESSPRGDRRQGRDYEQVGEDEQENHEWGFPGNLLVPLYAWFAEDQEELEWMREDGAERNVAGAAGTEQRADEERKGGGGRTNHKKGGEEESDFAPFVPRYGGRSDSFVPRYGGRSYSLGREWPIIPTPLYLSQNRAQHLCLHNTSYP